MIKRTLSLIFVLLILSATAMVSAQDFDGYALYNKMGSKTAYLIDKNQSIAHTWSCANSGTYSVYLMKNGNLMRPALYYNNKLNGAAVSGMVQEIAPNGSTVWSFVYSTTMYCTHHDIQPLPNGNVLLVAWEVKTAAQAVQAGSKENDETWPVHIVEVEPVGTNQGNIVWEWHIWDHLIQDHDPTKDNYGVVADHPELLNLNVDAKDDGGMDPPGGHEWLHTNGIGYNEELDQITFSMRNLSEVFIIDHSTTTAEAAGHTGGNSGMGGDIIYRWGNPSNYDAPGTQGIPNAVHDAHWTPPGYPNEGYLMFFNNDGSSGKACIDAIETPRDGYKYDLTPGSSYEPQTATWRHVCLGDASGQSSAARLPNGNTFVCLSNAYMYEVDSNGNKIWQYNQGPTKAYRYTSDFPGLIPLGLGTGLVCDKLSISATTGGSTQFSLEAGSDHKNRNYLLLGSLTGTSPGTALPGGYATLPLNWDAYTDLMMLFLNTSLFTNFMGKLDANGNSTAVLNAPPLPPTLVGVIMYYAFTVNNPFDYASNPVSIYINP